MPHSHSEGRLKHVIKTYDAADAGDVCVTVRSQAKSSRWIAELVEFYQAAIDEYKSDQDFWTSHAKLKETQQMAEFLAAWSKDVDLVGIHPVQMSDLDGIENAEQNASEKRNETSEQAS